MERNFYKILVFSFVFSALIFIGHSRRVQQFSLYSVTDASENYTKNVPDLELFSDIVRDNKLQSVCSQMGVWAFFTGKNYTTIHSYGYHPATPAWTCAKRRIMADWQSPFRSLRHVGNSDLDTSSLSLYKEPFFASDELYVNGQELSFVSSQFDFGSFGFTGRDSWTLYAGPNFSGDSVCLQCKCDEAGLSIGVTYTAKLTISASSLRRGCFGNQVLQPSGILEKRVPTNSELSFTSSRNSVSLTLSLSDSNSSMTFSGTELRLPCMMTFDTFQISGTSNWMVFSGPNFDGQSACLSFSPNFNTGRGNMRDSGSEPTKFGIMPVASVRSGCPQNLAQSKNKQTKIYIADSKDNIAQTTFNLPQTNVVTTPIVPTTNVVTTPRSREGRGHQLGPQYIPGDIQGFKITEVKFTERPIKKRPEPSIPTNPPPPTIVIIHPPPSGILSTTSKSELNLKVTPNPRAIDLNPNVNLVSQTTTVKEVTSAPTTIPPIVLTNPPQPSTFPPITIPDSTTPPPLQFQPAVTTFPPLTAPLQPAETTFPPFQPAKTTFPQFQPAKTTFPPFQPAVTTFPPFQLAGTTLPPFQPAETPFPPFQLAGTTFQTVGTTSPSFQPAATTFPSFQPAVTAPPPPFETAPPQQTTFPPFEPITAQTAGSEHENLLEPEQISEVTAPPQSRIPPTEHQSHSPPPDSYDGSQEVTEEPIRKDNAKVNEVDAPPPRHATGHEAATVLEAGSGPAGMFFTAFLIILGILVAAMVVTIGVFIYLRATRSAEADLE